MAQIAGTRDAAGDALIDQALPDWQWREYHQRRIKAAPPAVWQALLSAPTDFLRLSRQLLWLRTLGRSIPPRGAPIIDSFPPRLIAVAPPDGLLLGLVFPTSGRFDRMVQPDSVAGLQAARGPGLVRLAVDYRLRPLPGGGTLLSTETRAIANDAAARRRFALYWLMIRAGSGLIRRDVLRAVARQAENPPPGAI